MSGRVTQPPRLLGFGALLLGCSLASAGGHFHDSEEPNRDGYEHSCTLCCFKEHAAATAGAAAPAALRPNAAIGGVVHLAAGPATEPEVHARAPRGPPA